MQQRVSLVPFISLMHLAQCWEKFQVSLEDTRHLHSQEVKHWTMDHGVYLAESNIYSALLNYPSPIKLQHADSDK